jgi:shikimate kinase
VATTSQPAGNIVLIGMPAVGKSTTGVLLAKRLSKSFIDTDVLLQREHGMSLREFMDRHGVDRFRRIEADCVLSLECHDTVISTGGSVVYSDAAMQHLRSLGTIVFLDADVAELEHRIGNLDRRGVVRSAGQPLRELYAQRSPLYRRYADVTVDCAGQRQDAIVEAIVASLHC